jgi:hypothetical protein
MKQAVKKNTKPTKPTKAPKPTKPPHAYATPKANCTTVLFDLDETLIQCQSLANTAPVLKPMSPNDTERQLPTTRFPSHSTYFVDKTPDCKYIDIIHIRPHTLPFLAFCFDHCNVAFWSTGTADYVKNIVAHLLYYSGKTTKDILFAWARTSTSGTRAPNTDTKFIDVFTGEPIPFSSHQSLTYTSHKDLAYVFERFPSVSKTYTILVDNLPSHQATNEYDAVLYIPPFCYLNTHDTVLLKLTRMMQRLLNKQDSAKATAKQKPAHNATTLLRMTKHDVCAIGLLSPTNNRITYPRGYIEQETNQHFKLDASLLKTGQAVIVPWKNLYVFAKVKTLHENTRTATVYFHQDTPSTTTPTSAKRNKKRMARTRKHKQLFFNVSYEDIVDMQYHNAYDLNKIPHTI